MFPDETDFAQKPVPSQVIGHDIWLAGPVSLRLGHGPEANKGWVQVADTDPLKEPS